MSDSEECFSNKLVLTVVTASLGATNIFMLLLLGMMFIKYRKVTQPKQVSLNIRRPEILFYRKLLRGTILQMLKLKQIPIQFSVIRKSGFC